MSNDLTIYYSLFSPNIINVKADTENVTFSLQSKPLSVSITSWEKKKLKAVLTRTFNYFLSYTENAIVNVEMQYTALQTVYSE